MRKKETDNGLLVIIDSDRAERERWFYLLFAHLKKE